MVLVDENGKELVQEGALYAHYKNQAQLYKVLGFAVSEADNTVQVVYKAQQGAHLTFTRPLHVWLEKVVWEGKEVPRFNKVHETF